MRSTQRHRDGVTPQAQVLATVAPAHASPITITRDLAVAAATWSLVVVVVVLRDEDTRSDLDTPSSPPPQALRCCATALANARQKYSSVHVDAPNGLLFV